MEKKQHVYALQFHDLRISMYLAFHPLVCWSQHFTCHYFSAGSKFLFSLIVSSEDTLDLVNSQCLKHFDKDNSTSFICHTFLLKKQLLKTPKILSWKSATSMLVRSTKEKIKLPHRNSISGLLPYLGNLTSTLATWYPHFKNIYILTR